jgi:hypothetical protein
MSDVGQQSDPRSDRPARAGWAALRQFRFRDIQLCGERWRSGAGRALDFSNAARFSHGVIAKQAALKDRAKQPRYSSCRLINTVSPHRGWNW